jgi:hypothetical protein
MPVVVNELEVLVEPPSTASPATAAPTQDVPTLGDLDRALATIEARRDRVRAH